MRYSGIGGQAVMEGVMMKNQEKYAVAVRKPDGEIALEVSEYKGIIKNKKIRNMPVLRGVFSFIESLYLGVATLTFSASFFEEEETDQKEKTKKQREKKVLTEEQQKRQDSLMMGGTVAFSIVLAVAIFMILPYYISVFFQKFTDSYMLIAVLEGLIRLAIFIGYVAAISLMPDIKRVYMYHGAEHKCINCIEHGMDLTVENVRKSSRLHKRCGTSFLLIVMIISIFFFMFIHVDSRVLRLVLRLVLIPVIAGVSFEFIRLAGRSDNALINLLSKPGLLLQHITTKEPEDDMIEVGIASVVENMTYREAINLGEKVLNMADVADAKIDAWLLLEMVCKIDRSFYYLHMEDEVAEEQLSEYEIALRKRAEHVPLQYIVGEAEFMGLKFKVNSNVLIPRQDTETLVEEALKVVKPEMKVLDMCTGSGCIIVSIVHNIPEVEGTATDISKQALLVAKENAKLNQVSVTFERSDLFDNVTGTYDVIVSNPPYIRTGEVVKLMPEVQEFEPMEALDGKEDGLYFYRKIIKECKAYLKPGGHILFEIGYDQGEAVSGLLKEAGFKNVTVIKDLAHNDRVVTGMEDICLIN